jgi:ParB family transcriptional regulator, chromosome partitioning protein
VAASNNPDALVRDVIRKGLSVRQVEEQVRKEKAKRDPAAAIARSGGDGGDKSVDADLQALERQLGDILGLKVDVLHKAQGGAVTVHYSSLEQLDMICQRLSGEPI